MMTSVRRAFSHSGLRNAVTPFEIASTPVTAAPPDANALSTIHSPAPKNRPAPSASWLKAIWPVVIELGGLQRCR